MKSEQLGCFQRQTEPLHAHKLDFAAGDQSQFFNTEVSQDLCADADFKPLGTTGIFLGGIFQMIR